MKLNKASFQYMFALLFSVTALFAQNITGTVNGDDGSALAGANVAVEGTDSGASSNQDGSFSISGLSDGTYTVTASYIGYEDASAVVTISGGQASSVNLTLDRGDIRLNQVVVSASLKKELVTEAPASVTVFGGEELEARSATTLTDVIGNQAGVEYMKTGLESSNLSLRGFNGVFSGAIHAVVDNRWTRAPVVNAQLLQFFAPDDSDVDRVELVRGPASPMYGPDTQQGVISLFTKSPFNQGNRIALTVGDRNFMKIYGRVAHQWGARAATRVSFSHRSFDDWESNMPRSLTEAQAQGHSYYEPELIRRGLQTTAYPFIDYTASGYNDPVEGSPNSASSAEPFSPEATVFETKTEFRPDLKSNLTINTRMANLSAIEMTGVGRQFADDVDLYQFQVAYFRQDVLGGDLYLNFFTNINDQKTTYSLVNGNVVYDESSNRAFQLQHTVPMKNGQTVIWGLDYLDRTPETKGTINGKNEDNDDFDNLGVYYSYEKKFSDRFKFVGTGRLDQNNYLDAIGTSSVFAPKLAFVWSPEDVRGNFRLTYGENIDLPGNFPKNLDIAVYRDFVYKQGLGIDFQSAAFGSLPFNPDIQVKAMGSQTTGWTYDRDANGVPTYRSNWSPALGLDVNTNYAMGNSTMNAAAFGVWSPIMMGSILQSEGGQGYNAAFAAQVAAGYAAATGDTAGAAAYGAAQAAAASQAVMALASTVSPSAYSNVVIDENQTEFGYKGQITDNMTLSVDVYDLVISDYITNLQNISGMVTVLGDGGSYVGNVLTYLATAGDANLVNWINGWDAAAAGGNGNGTGADEFAGLLLGTVAQAPIGMIAPEQSPYGGNLIFGYKQLTEDLNLQGLEVAMNYFPSAEWTFNMNMSLLSDSSLTVDFEGVEQFVNMNTPKFKLGGGMQYASDDVSYGLSLRYQDSYFADGFSGTSGEVEGFYTVGVNAKWNLEAVDGMSVGLSIDNITDVVHRETFLGPEMGRFTSISLGYDL
ncbi:PEGA domain-containing protein [bacterium]|nr:PEGA domain-containing protein [bacterium]